MFSRQSTMRWEENDVLMLSLGRGNLNLQKWGGGRVGEMVQEGWEVTERQYVNLTGHFMTSCKQSQQLAGHLRHKKSSSQAEQKNCILSNLTERRRLHFLNGPLWFSLGQSLSQRALTPQDFSSCHRTQVSGSLVWVSSTSRKRKQRVITSF